MTTLEKFNEAKSNNDWQKAQEIIKSLCGNSENGENDLTDGHFGSKVAEFENERDAQQERGKRLMGLS